MLKDAVHAGADRETLKQGVRISRKLAEANAWKGMIKSEMHPGASVETDADLDQYIADSMHSGNALVGTCAMGDANKVGGLASFVIMLVSAVFLQSLSG